MVIKSGGICLEEAYEFVGFDIMRRFLVEPGDRDASGASWTEHSFHTWRHRWTAVRLDGQVRIGCDHLGKYVENRLQDDQRQEP